MITRLTGVVVDGSSPSSGAAPSVPTIQVLAQPLAEDHDLHRPHQLRRRAGAAHGEPHPERPQAHHRLSGQHLPFGKYFYDVWYNDTPGNRSQVVPVSPFDVRDAVGRPGEPTSVPGVEPPPVPADDGLLALAFEALRAVVGQLAPSASVQLSEINGGHVAAGAQPYFRFVGTF